MLFNKNFLLILLANVLLGAPMPMLIILGGLAGPALAPAPALITVPVSVQMLAGILVAAPLSLLMGHRGRRVGFLVVAATTTFGAALAVGALWMSSFVLLCMAHLLMGAALIGVNFLRFAAAEVVTEQERPNAISFTLASGIVAAMVGPGLFNMASDAVDTVPFAGAYLVIAALGIAGMAPIFAMRLPDHIPREQLPGQTFGVGELLCRAPVRMAVVAAAAAQAVMILLMVPTPQAMVALGFDQTLAADVIRWHVVAMFAPGLFTGMLIKRVGVVRVITAGLWLLVLASVVAAAGTSATHFYVSLVFLGLGWNFGFIGGTQLLQVSVTAEEKPRIQGFNDTVIALAAVSASVVSGVMYVGAGWRITSLMLLPVLGVVILWLKREARRGLTMPVQR